MMNEPLLSFEKLNYLLRPSKQVERKLLIETFHRLAQANYNITEYTYLGLGSVYFVDFVLLHRYLYIDDMICVEREAIPNRMAFNQPYKFIRLEMMAVAQFIPSLVETQRYLVWLDYDTCLELDILDDLDGFLQNLSAGSILVVTVDARAQLPQDEDTPSLSEQKRLTKVLKFYRHHFEKYAGGRIAEADIGEKDFPALLARIIRSKIGESMRGRPDCEFSQLFNFLYSDNAPMLTIGGLIDREGTCEGLFNGCLKGMQFLTPDETPVEITVPPLTERERQWIDSNLDKAKRSKTLPFELNPVMVKAYRKFARHYPSYHEAVV